MPTDHEIIIGLYRCVEALAAAAKIDPPTVLDGEGVRYPLAPAANHFVGAFGRSTKGADAEPETPA